MALLQTLLGPEFSALLAEPWWIGEDTEMEIDSSPAMSTKLLKKKKNHAVITITLEVCGK